jgi:hypothetical protein
LAAAAPNGSNRRLPLQRCDLTATPVAGYHTDKENRGTSPRALRQVVRREMTGATRDTPASRSFRKPWGDATRPRLARIPSLAFRSTRARSGPPGLRRRSAAKAARSPGVNGSMRSALDHSASPRGGGGDRSGSPTNKGGATRHTPLVLCDGRRIVLGEFGHARRHAIGWRASDPTPPEGTGGVICWTSRSFGSIPNW